MQIVIEIPVEQYNIVKSKLYNTFPADMRKWGLEAIRNGTPLPEGYGLWISKIEADKEESEGKKNERT